MKPTVFADAIADELRSLRRARPGEPLRLERRADGLVWATTGSEAHAVTVRRCFPWSHPTRYVSLRDREENEVALVRELQDLDAPSQRVLEEALVEAGWVFEIERIESIEEEVEIRHWRVNTRQGRRQFQTKLDHWPRRLPGGGAIIRDVAGDLYRVGELTRLDKRSRDLLWAFID